jgi:hypothetical protein
LLAAEAYRAAQARQLVVNFSLFRPVPDHYLRSVKHPLQRASRVALRQIVQLGPLSRPDFLEIGVQRLTAIEAIPNGFIGAEMCGACSNHCSHCRKKNVG